MKLKPIADQVIVLLGASSGVGRETARLAARRGARVVAAARSQEGLASLVDEIRAEGGQAIAIVADAASFEQVQAVADQAVAEYGRIDTWVNCAATSLYGTFEQTTPEEFHRIVEVNLLGQVYGDMAALPYLKQAGQGALIHVSSIEAQTPVPLHIAYNTSKHGLQGLIDSLRLELQHEGAAISVTNIMPASMNTPFFEKTRTKLGVQPRGIPPIYEPRLAAEAILYAAEHPTREIPVGVAGRALLFMRRWSPRLVAAGLQRTAYRAQRTDIPKGADAPNSLFQPLPGYDRVEGNMGPTTRTDVYTWLRLHPAARLAVAGLALGVVAGGLAIAVSGAFSTAKPPRRIGAGKIPGLRRRAATVRLPRPVRQTIARLTGKAEPKPRRLLRQAAARLTGKAEPRPRRFLRQAAARVRGRTRPLVRTVPTIARRTVRTLDNAAPERLRQVKDTAAQAADTARRESAVAALRTQLALIDARAVLYGLQCGIETLFRSNA